MDCYYSYKGKKKSFVLFDLEPNFGSILSICASGSSIGLTENIGSEYNQFMTAGLVEQAVEVQVLLKVPLTVVGSMWMMSLLWLLLFLVSIMSK